MPKEPDNNPVSAPKILRAKYRWSEYDASPAPHGMANLSSGMWEFYDGTTRKITEEEWEAILS